MGLLAGAGIALSSTPSISKTGETIFNTASWSRESRKCRESGPEMDPRFFPARLDWTCVSILRRLMKKEGRELWIRRSGAGGELAEEDVEQPWACA